MDKKVVFTKHAPAAIGPYSQAIVAGNLVFLSGQLPINPATGEMPEGITRQTEQSLKNAQAILKEIGLDFAHVVKTTVFLSAMDHFTDMNAVYSQFFSSDYPARSAVEVAKLPKDALVEIEMIAVME